MKLSLLSQSCSGRHTATKSVGRLLGISGVGLILCGQVSFAQPPIDAGTLFLQAPPADLPMPNDDEPAKAADPPAKAAEPPAKAADVPVEPAPPPVRAVPARAKA